MSASMSYEWQDKVVLITGGANGIGANVVKLVLEEGAKHIAILDVDKKGLDFQSELNSQFGPGRTQFHQCDVTNDDHLFSAFQSVVADQGSLDVVINNAGIMNDSPNMYKREIDINLTATITSALKGIELMRADEGGKGGTVINISSVAGLRQSYFVPIYSATKAAVILFSSCIGDKQKYFKKTGVRVLTVCFGATATSLCSPTKLGSHEKNFTPEKMYSAVVAKVYIQKPESAARGVIEAYTRGESGSTWLAARDLPARDITDNVTRAYVILGEHT